MGSEPSEDDIQQLLSMELVPTRSESINKLKANGNNLQRTVDAIFDGPGIDPLEVHHRTNDVWDEQEFHTDKNNTVEINPSAAAYPGQPGYLQPDIFSAPSRPPSRVNSQSFVDLTAEHAQANPEQSLSAAQRREEDELQRAMELSMTDAGPQETGVTTSRAVHFGPATQDYYDTSKWSLTTQTPTEEIVLDPEPVERRRGVGEPAFLKPAPSGYYLGSFLTIVHSIPLAREYMLCRDFTLRSYRHHDEWWNGTQIKTPTILRYDNDGVIETPEELIFETQRLMAFLDLTERSYGSVEGLARLDFVSDDDPDQVLVKYIQAWQDVMHRKTHSEEQADIFYSIGVKRNKLTGEELGRQSFPVLELRLEDEVEKPSQTLYEAMDEMIWESPTTDDNTVAYLERVGDIFSIRVIQANPASSSGCKIDVPLEWYPDRYLEQNQAAAAEMRKMRVEAVKEVIRLDKEYEFLTDFQPRGWTRRVDPRWLLQGVVRHLRKPIWGPDNPDKNGITRAAMIDELQEVYANLMKRIPILEEEMKVAKKNLEEASKPLLTQFSDDATISPQHPYTLRGVCTDPDTTYLLFPVVEGDEKTSNPEEEDNATGTNKKGLTYEWWKIVYSEMDPKPVVKIKVMEEEVLHAARNEGRLALLVYASKRAVEMNTIPTDGNKRTSLPAALEEFVRKDNVAFKRELRSSTLQTEVIDTSAVVGATPEREMTERKKSDPYMSLPVITSLETVLRKQSAYTKELSTTILSAASSDEGSMEVQWGGNTPPSPSHDSLTFIHSDEVQDENDVFPICIDSGIGKTRPGIVFNIENHATQPTPKEATGSTTEEATGVTADTSEKDDLPLARSAYPTLQLRGAKLAAMAENDDSNQKDQGQNQEELPQPVASKVEDKEESDVQQLAVTSTHNDDDQAKTGTERRASEPRMKVDHRHD